MEHRIPCSGGGQLTRRPHALSYDGDAIIVCNADRLCVYSTLSGERLYDLRGHVDEVTGICLHPRSKNQVCIIEMCRYLGLITQNTILLISM